LATSGDFYLAIDTSQRLVQSETHEKATIL